MVLQDDQKSSGRMAAIARDLRAGLAHHQAGRCDRAEVLYRKVLRKAPDNVDALRLLGLVAHQRGRHEYAVQLISRALAGLSESAEVHLDLGCALQALDRPDEAATSYRRAIALKPDLALAHSNMSALLNARGAFEAALESAGRAVELMPELVAAHVNRAVAFSARRRFVEAETAYRSALALEPNSAETLSDLGQVLSELRRFNEAIVCHQQAIALQPNNARVHYRLGATLFHAGELYASETSCRRAIALDPNFARAWSGLGQLLRSLGRFDQSVNCFHRALELDPELPDAHAGLAMIGQRVRSEAELQHLRTLLANPKRPAPARIDAGFALGMLLDNADRCDEAFPCFAEANALYRRQLAASGGLFNYAALRQQVDSLIESCTQALYSTVEGSGNPSEAPVFIVGMQRSGTSLVEQIAATHSRVFGAGELSDISRIVDTVEAHTRGHPADELDSDLARRLADDHVMHLQSLGVGKMRVIDKMPDNIILLGFIALLFPSARIIFCRRDLRDTCLSCYFHRFDWPVPWSYDLVDCGLRALEIERLANHWREVLPLRMLTIDYETLVDDLEGESRRLIEFLGLDWEPACLEFHNTERPVLTSSGWQVRQPLFTRSVGRWRKYERHLGPLLQVLGQGGAAGGL